jgi:hypothetical protein
MAPLPSPDHYLYEMITMTAAEAKRKWRSDIKEHWGNRCIYCGNTENLTLDHVRPKTRGGRDETNNLVPACLSCNRQKGSSHWLSWWVGQDSFDHSNFSKVLSWTTS